jgi:hypothetical protein
MPKPKQMVTPLARYCFEQHPGHRGAAGRPTAHPRKVGAGETGMLAEEQVDGGHAEHHGGLLLQQFHGLVHVELAHDQRGGTEHQQAVHVEVEAAGVEIGQHREHHVIASQAGVDGVGQRVGDVHAPGLRHALWFARAAGGVEQVPDVVVLAPGHFDRGTGHFGQGAFVAGDLWSCGTGHHAIPDLQGIDQGHPGGIELLAPDQRNRLCIAEHTLEFVDRKPPVEADHHRTDLAAAVEHLDVVGGTVRQQRHPVAGLDLPAIAQELGEAAGPLVELGIADATAAVEVDQGGLGGELARVFDEVIGYLHGVLLFVLGVD